MNHELKKLGALTHRNIKIYFKDKILFFVSLITPMILIILFLTFLGKVYQDSLLAATQLPDGTLPDKLINGFTGGWLFSSIIAVSGVTVAFCSNVMVNDKINKAIDDFNITPVKKSTIQLSYFLANFLTTMIVCLVTLVIGMIYLAIVGWYLSVLDVVMIILVMTLNTLFGTLLASIVGQFLNTQGGLSGVSSMVSSMYGFVAGAYMPISQFAPVIQTVLKFLPGTYFTVLLRSYFMRGVLVELNNYVEYPEIVDGLRNAFDGNLVLFDNEVPTWAMFMVVIGTLVVLLALYFLVNYLQRRRYQTWKKHA